MGFDPLPEQVQDLDVLIVDDATTIRGKVRSLLSELSIPQDHIREASNAKDALEAFEEGVPDLVFMDLILPDLPGEEVGSVLMEKHPDTNVIPMTALNPNDRRVRHLVSKGAMGVVEKPVRRRAIQDMMRLLYEEELAEPGD